MRSERSLTRNVGNRGDHINRISMREYQHSGGDKNNSSNSQFLYVDENNSYDDNSPRSNKTTDLIESKYDLIPMLLLATDVLSHQLILIQNPGYSHAILTVHFMN